MRVIIIVNSINSCDVSPLPIFGATEKFAKSKKTKTARRFTRSVLNYNVITVVLFLLFILGV